MKASQHVVVASFSMLFVIWIIMLIMPSSSSWSLRNIGSSLPITERRRSSVFNFRSSRMSLRYAEDSSKVGVADIAAATGTVTSEHQVFKRVPTKAAPYYYYLSEDDISKERDELKKELVVAAIENYDIEAYNKGMTTIAEDIMKRLEPIRPWKRPAHSDKLNARWSFVFTGVPTIGMKLITLLSRISVGFPPVDFRDVFLEVSKQQTEVKAIVSVVIFGQPLELNVFTSLRPDPEGNQHGTMLIEQFQGITLAGIEIPTPISWRRARNLEISYLDDDMMIARTAGGEPHFLLRHSTCSTDAIADECDIDTELTMYFQEARAKYGEKIARCLVDRSYGESCDDSSSTSPVVNLLNFNFDWLFKGNK